MIDLHVVLPDADSQMGRPRPTITKIVRLKADSMDFRDCRRLPVLRRWKRKGTQDDTRPIFRQTNDMNNNIDMKWPTQNDNRNLQKTRGMVEQLRSANPLRRQSTT